MDALRGFDMLFIMGGGQLILSICAACGAADSAFAQQFHHVPWEGFHFEDTIFPLFLFVAGVSFPFSMDKRLANGATKASLCWHSIRRGLTLVFLGFVANRVFRLDFDHLRYYGVLQLIGFSWMVAALLFIGFGAKVRAVIAVVLLLGSWLFFRSMGAPDFPEAAPFTPEGNFGCWIDRTVIGTNHIYKKLFDPEGAASLLPSIVMPMLGMFAGQVLKGPLSDGRKTLLLLGSSVLLVASGLLFSGVQPIVKAMWSSSFVLVAGGYAAAMLAVFYWIIDVKGWRGWSFFFTVIGMNSITIYMAQRIVDFRGIASFFLGGLASRLSPDGQSICMNAGYVLFCWLFLLFLYRKKVFLKV